MSETTVQPRKGSVVKFGMRAGTAEKTEAPAKEPAPPPATFESKRGVDIRNKWLKFLFYGDPGAGKTILAASAADCERFRDVFYIDADDGLSSVVTSGLVENTDRIIDARCPDYETFDKQLKFLRRYAKAWEADDYKALEKGAKVYGFDPEVRMNTVVVDTMSKIEEHNIVRRGDPEAGQSLLIDIEPAYKENKHDMTRAIRELKLLPFHVIIVCHMLEHFDSAKGGKDDRPKLAGQLPGEAVGAVDFAGYMTQSFNTETSERTVSANIQPTGRFMAKSRLTKPHIERIDGISMPALESLIFSDS